MKFVPKISALAVAFLVAVLVFTGGVYWFAYTSALDQLEERGRSDLTLASDRVVGQLEQFRELAVIMADHPVIVDMVRGRSTTETADALLVSVADKVGPLDIRLVDAAGQVLSRSVSQDIVDEVSTRKSFRRAMQGALGIDHGISKTDGRRVYTFAAPVFGEDGRPIGAVMVDVGVWAVEDAWRGEPHAVFFTDDQGIVFVTNRSELLFRARFERAPSTPSSDPYNFATAAAMPFARFSTVEVGGHEIWTIDGGRYLPEKALHLTMPLPVVGLTGEILLDVSPAAGLAALQSAVAAALCLVLGGALLFVTERRRALSVRLSNEAAVNAVLEQRVAERTQALEAANADLRHQIGERVRAEVALKKAQADLVQAGKLSALGQMSAGISHELNQPLMAIRSFAENAEQFLDRDKPEIARQNLQRIADLARRIGRIIKNLRAFARQETEAISDVDLGGVVESVLEMAASRLSRDQVKVDWTLPKLPVMVRGGEVRLQQVVMNLVSNALDAMQTSEEPRLEISIQNGSRVLLRVRDFGPGIDEPDKMFDPFYTTKEVGHSEGLGLGLSISYGLVQSFGGMIKGRNVEGGGAELTVELAASGMEAAA